MHAVNCCEKYSPLKDIDIDLAPSKRPEIFNRIREMNGPLSIAQVATFGTEGTKSGILAACRGYRSEDYPEGIDVDVAQYMSSLIPQERGFLWDIKDVVYGNEEKGRKPIHSFLSEVNKYPGLLEIIEYICGLVNKRGVHASGAVFYDNDPYETTCFMQSPGGDIITGWDLHDLEAGGGTKYDFLVTEASDKIIKCYELLKKDNKIEKDMSLRSFYNTYLHPEVIDVENKELWEHLAAGDILDVFQFSTGVGLMIAKKLQPKTMNEMTAANALMRLMAEKGQEPQQDRYLRIKNNPLAFEQEMRACGLTTQQKAAFHKHCDEYYGTVPLQEQMMEILMDPDIANFTLGEANAARKVVAKKQMNKIPELRKQLYDKVGSVAYADYIWKTAVAPSLGYAFSKNHSLPYSFVGIQMIYLATHWDAIYWDTACLIVNSGAIDENNGTSTNYGKIAKAIGEITTSDVDVKLVDINQSDFGFTPDVENSAIRMGLKNLVNVGDDFIKTIIENRPYQSPKDFVQKVNPKKQAMISLIKAGAFDKMEDRKFVMAWYLWTTCKPKTNLNLTSLSTLLNYNLVPLDEESIRHAYRIFEFNRYLKAKCRQSASDLEYHIDIRAIDFLTEQSYEDLIYNNEWLNAKIWDKIYQKEMDVFRSWINRNKTELLFKLNSLLFKEEWDKYASGSLARWEMEAACIYYHDHELYSINSHKYGLIDFFELPEEPEVDKYWHRGKQSIPIFKLSKIAGTCIDKNKTKSTVTLLTPTGVVEVKFRKEYFALFDRQISDYGADGKKHIVERSWFKRGNMIIINGMRSGDNFICKKYASTIGHQLYKINEITINGDLILQDERYKGGIEEEDEEV